MSTPPTLLMAHFTFYFICTIVPEICSPTDIIPRLGQSNQTYDKFSKQQKIDCIHEESRTADDVTVKLVGEGSHTTSLPKFQNLSTPPKPVFKNVSVTLRQIEKHQLITSNTNNNNNDRLTAFDPGQPG